jgi:hypothetical protein
MAKKPLTLVTEVPAPDVAAMPVGLGEHGSRMWRLITTEYHVADCGGRLLLEQCCHAADMVVRLRAQVDKDGLMIEMASGMRAHPAIREELGYRSFVASALKKLGILDEAPSQFGGKYKQYGGVV